MALIDKKDIFVGLLMNGMIKNFKNEDELKELFGASIVAEKSTDDATFYLFENNIYYVNVKEFTRVTMDLVNVGYEFIRENGGGKYFNIFKFDSFSDVDPEVRKWAAGHNDAENNKHSLLDALVISGLAHRIIVNFYLNTYKPVVPTKVFTDTKKAIDWVNSKRL